MKKFIVMVISLFMFGIGCTTPPANLETRRMSQMNIVKPSKYIDAQEQTARLEAIQELQSWLKARGTPLPPKQRIATNPQYSLKIAAPGGSAGGGGDDEFILEIEPIDPVGWCSDNCVGVSFSQCRGYPEQWRLEDCNGPIYDSCYAWCMENYMQ